MLNVLKGIYTFDDLRKRKTPKNGLDNAHTFNLDRLSLIKE